MDTLPSSVLSLLAEVCMQWQKGMLLQGHSAACLHVHHVPHNPWVRHSQVLGCGICGGAWSLMRHI